MPVSYTHLWTGSLTKPSEKVEGKHPTQKPEYLLERIILEMCIRDSHVYVMEKGKVVMDGTPREIFSRVDELKEHRLDAVSYTHLIFEQR